MIHQSKFAHGLGLGLYIFVHFLDEWVVSFPEAVDTTDVSLLGQSEEMDLIIVLPIPS